MPRESHRKKQARALRLWEGLRSLYPDARCTLNFRSAWELLVGAMLAAQCTDARVNKITAELFPKYPSMEAFAEASQEEMEAAVRSSGLYRNKAKNLRATAALLLEKHHGKVPKEMEALLALPGVGRKIANLIRGDFYQIPGLVVDTHCARLAKTMGLSQAKSAPAIERALCALLPEERWTSWGHLMVAHGRERCQARRRSCAICPLDEDCAHGRTLQSQIRAAREAGQFEARF